MFDLDRVKTQQFCEASSIFELDNIESERILQDFLNVSRWQHQKRRSSARLPSRMESWTQTASYQCVFAICPLYLSKVLRLWRKIIFVNLTIWCSKMQALTGNHWLPNISDEHVLYCARHAKSNPSLQNLFKCPNLPSFLDLLQNPHVLLIFGKVQNPLRLPHKTTLQRPKVAQACGVLSILTSTCASRHNGVHCLNISTSKSALNVVCFVHFDFEMCFGPQRSTSQLQKVVRTRQFLTLLASKCASRHNRVNFLNISTKWSEPVSF